MEKWVCRAAIPVSYFPTCGLPACLTVCLSVCPPGTMHWMEPGWQPAGVMWDGWGSVWVEHTHRAAAVRVHQVLQLHRCCLLLRQQYHLGCGNRLHPEGDTGLSGEEPQHTKNTRWYYFCMMLGIKFFRFVKAWFNCNVLSVDPRKNSFY